jgi:hypothetical protein
VDRPGCSQSAVMSVPCDQYLGYAAIPLNITATVFCRYSEEAADPVNGPANFLLPDDRDLDFYANLHQYPLQEFELLHPQAPSVSRSGSFPAGIFLLLENCDEVIKAVQAVV